MTYLYPESCGDYYPKNWSTANYHDQMNVILNREDGASLAVTNHEFISVSVIRKIFEAIKGLFGFTDLTEKTRINSELLKFLCKGAELGFIDSHTLERLKSSRITYPSYLTHQSVQRLIDQIASRHFARSPEEAERHLNTMHATLIEYHHENGLQLRPSFWSRLIRGPYLNAEKLVDFGDSHLEMSKLALSGKQPQYSSALDHLLKAHDAHNTSSQFQQKLWIQLKSFLDQFKTTQTAISQQTTIQNVIISIASIALQHNEKEKAVGYLNYLLELYPTNDHLRYRVGECYLNFECDDEVRPFLQTLRQYYSQNSEKQEKIGNILWKQGKITEAIETYQTAIALYKKDIKQKPALGARIADISAKIGNAYLEKKEGCDGEDSSEKALQYYGEAVQFKTNQIEYQDGLCRAYIQMWEKDSENFEKKYGESWLHFVSNCDYSVRQDHAALLKPIFYFCAERAQGENKTKLAENYLLQAVTLYHMDPDYICEIIQKCIEFKMIAGLFSKVAGWDKQYSKHALLKERIGDIYWAKGDKPKASAYWKEALPLYEADRNALKKEADQTYCKEKLSQLNVRIGDQQLAESDFDKAIASLKEAFKHDPNKKQELFQAYVKAGDAEGSKNYFTYSLNKHIEFYQNAFELDPQNGPYLQKLFALYFKNGKTKEILDLFLAIQKQAWASEFNLSADFTIKIVVQLRTLNAKNHGELILKTLEKAYIVDPAHAKLKEELFAHRFVLSRQEAEQADKNDFQNRITNIEKAIELLRKNIQTGFDKVTKLKGDQEKYLAKLHAKLAEVYVEQVLFVDIVPYDGKDKIKHYESHEKNIKLALEHYSKAIELNKNEASFHFDKAIVLEEFAIEPEEAIKAYLRAVELNNKNPFYNKCLALAYTAYKNDAAKKTQYEGAIPSDVQEEFAKVYQHWKTNRLLKNKENPIINPHTFEIKRGWFSSQLKRVDK